MRLLFLIWLMIPGFCVYSFSQNPVFFISGVVTDAENHTPLKNVNITVKVTNAITKTNVSGFYKIEIPKTPATLVFTHVSYKEKTLQISANSSQSMNISLETQVNILNEVSISPEVPLNIIKDKPLYVKDYDFYGNDIVMLAYRNKHISSPELMLMNLQGDSLNAKEIPRPEKLYKDCMGNIHLIAQDEGFQIFIDSAKLQLIYPASSENYEQTLSPCVKVIYEKFFLKNYLYNNQLLQYYFYKDAHAKPYEFLTIADDAALHRLKDKSRLASMQGYTEDDERFEQMCFYAPLYAPLVNFNDTVMIFDFVNSKIEFFDSEAKSIKETNISFHKDHQWRKEIFVDDVRNKVYTLYREQGISKLCEVNLVNGTLGKSVQIPDFTFIEKIRVHDGKVYFLYTEKNQSTEYKQLYSFRI